MLTIGCDYDYEYVDYRIGTPLLTFDELSLLRKSFLPSALTKNSMFLHPHNIYCGHWTIFILNYCPTNSFNDHYPSVPPTKHAFYDLFAIPFNMKPKGLNQQQTTFGEHLPAQTISITSYIKCIIPFHSRVIRLSRWYSSQQQQHRRKKPFSLLRTPSSIRRATLIPIVNYLYLLTNVHHHNR